MLSIDGQQTLAAIKNKSSGGQPPTFPFKNPHKISIITTNKDKQLDRIFHAYV